MPNLAKNGTCSKFLAEVCDVQAMPGILYVSVGAQSEEQVKRQLDESHYLVRTANSVEEAVNAANQESFAAVIFEFGPNGWEKPHTQTLKILQPLATFILVGPRHLDNIRSRDTTHDFSFVIQTPCSSEQFQSAVNKALQHYQQRTAGLLLGRAFEDATFTWSLEQRLEHSTIQGGILVTMSLEQALAARAYESPPHCRRVASYAVSIANVLAFETMEMAHLDRACLIHDLATIVVPDSMHIDASELSFDEWNFLREHADLGNHSNEDLPDLLAVQRIIAESQAHWDGTGRPRGLSGLQICASARVFSLARSFENLTTDKPGRPGMPVVSAILEIEQGSGTVFDPDVVQAFNYHDAKLWQSLREENVDSPDTP